MSDKKKRPKSKAAQATQAAREARRAERPPEPARPAGDAAAIPPRSAAPAPEAIAPREYDIPARFRGDAPESERPGGGLLSGMRGGFQSAVGGGPRKKGWTGTIIYILLLMALVAFIWGGY